DTIIESESFGGDRYGCHLKNRGCVWDERGLELVKEKKEKKPSKNTAIVIYRKGDDTIALDKDTGKTAKATCSKDDEYDFYTGAKLALGRLTEPTRKFKVGDKVIGNKKANGVYAITKEGWKGVVKEIHTYPYIVVEKNGFSPEVDENCFDLDLDTEAEAEEPIKVGDKVKVVDTGEVFTTDYTWVSVHVHDDTHKIRYAFNDGMGFDCGVYELAEIYTVMYIAEGKAYITVRPDDSYYPCYLVGLDGLEKV
ncbi:MAG: hypothetical protein J6S14_13200, partial [Clostridia bacterium]|nr:hypothetical protein [Clostridia bacterium]